MINLDGRWICFFDLRTDNRKTDVYGVGSKESDDVLGEVKWFAPWRRYVFAPYKGVVLEEVCMRDIANFCEQLTKEYKEKKKHN